MTHLWICESQPRPQWHTLTRTTVGRLGLILFTLATGFWVVQPWALPRPVSKTTDHEGYCASSLRLCHVVEEVRCHCDPSSRPWHIERSKVSCIGLVSPVYPPWSSPQLVRWFTGHGGLHYPPLIRVCEQWLGWWIMVHLLRCFTGCGSPY